MMSVLSAVLAMVFMLFFESILTVHLIKDLDLSENTAGKLSNDNLNIRLFFRIDMCDLCNLIAFCQLLDNIYRS